MNKNVLGDFPGGVDRKWGAINAPTSVTVDLAPAEERLKCRRCRWVGTHAELRKSPVPNEPSLSDNVCPRCACKTFTKEEQAHG